MNSTRKLLKMHFGFEFEEPKINLFFIKNTNEQVLHTITWNIRTHQLINSHSGVIDFSYQSKNFNCHKTRT